MDDFEKTVIEKYYEPLLAVLTKGIEQKIIKNVSFEILAAFMFDPIIALSTSRLSRDFKLDEQNIEDAFTLAWDAVKF